MPAYGIDTSVLLRLATGLPEEQAQRSQEAIEKLLEAPENSVVASNQVIGEAYIVLQKFYELSKDDSREALSNVLQSGYVEPLNGPEVLTTLTNSSGCGTMDRLIHQGYLSVSCHVLTNDGGMARLPNTETPESVLN